jgi:hypothetical protein
VTLLSLSGWCLSHRARPAPVRRGAGEPAPDGGDLPAIAGEARYRPLALSVLRVNGGRIVEVIDWSRLCSGAFGLPMSFPPSDRSNEDEVNAKEVR